MKKIEQATAEQVAMFFLQQGQPMKIYLAGPFFNPQQLNTVKTIEDILDRLDLIYFSPRQGGVILKDLTFEERAIQANRVYKENVDRLNWCDVVLAIIDDRDPGTYWELGYGLAKGKRLVTYTAHDYGLNVMLQEAVTAHVTNLDDLAYILKKGLPDEICALYRVFHQAVT
jgi:nucleoside 2-deoxyribosyltransferase